MMAKSDLVDIDVHLHHKTVKGGLLISTDGDRNNAVWVSDEHCQLEHKRGAGPNIHVATMPEWQALEKGLI